MAVPDSVEMGTGEQRCILLAGGGSAGYRWEVRIDDPQTVAVSVGPAEERPQASRGGAPPDAGSTPQVVLVRALQVGSARVTLELRRPWKPDDAPREAHTLLVNVVPPVQAQP